MPGKEIIFVISGASGSGKTTLAHRLREQVAGIEKTVSYTTRPPREGEGDGIAYHFVSKQEFTERIKRKAFVEHAEVHGNHYGTSAEQITRWLAAGRDVVCDIDVQGGRAIRKLYGERSVLIFILPPSWEELERRIRGRGTESDEVIQRRLENARNEHAVAREYDYLLMNDDRDHAVSRLVDIVWAERNRTWRALTRVPDGMIPAVVPKRRKSSRKSRK